jgi:MoaA/NifB/PqqE/SkfB family radical SAM enzyme
MRRDTVRRYMGILGRSLRRQFFGLDRTLGIHHMTFEVTNLCNSKCEMCNIWANKPNSSILTTEQIKKIFADPGFRELETVILTGGEMFLRDDIPDIVSAIWNVNHKVNIICSTNGILAPKVVAVAEQIAKVGIPVSYGISLDGLSGAHDKRRRVPGNFDAVDKVLFPGLQQLAKQYPGLITMAVGHCLDEYGITTFESVKQYCDTHNIPFMTQMIEDFDYYMPEAKRVRKADNWDQMIETKNGMAGENRIMKKEIYAVDHQKYAKFVKKLIPTVHHFRLLSILDGRSTRYECSSLRNFFLLRYDGNVAPCLRYADWEVANLKNTSLTELGASPIREKAVDEILKCDGCLNTWCTDWSMEKNALPFYREVAKWVTARFILRRKAVGS